MLHGISIAANTVLLAPVGPWTSTDRASALLTRRGGSRFGPRTGIFIGMGKAPQIASNIRSRVSPTRDDPVRFFFEIWKQVDEDSRMEIEISQTFPTEQEARRACNDALPLYIAKRGGD